MLTYEAESPAPADKVWSLLARPGRWHEWSPLLRGAKGLGTDEVQVNSVHGQGIHRLADGLRVEALAPDGLVEAFSVVPAAGGGFALGVQWHPEWQAADNPVSLAMLRAFGAACQDYRDLHRPPSR